MLESHVVPHMRGLEPPEVVAITSPEWAGKRLRPRGQPGRIVSSMQELLRIPPHPSLPAGERTIAHTSDYRLVACALKFCYLAGDFLSVSSIPSLILDVDLSGRWHYPSHGCTWARPLCCAYAVLVNLTAVVYFDSTKLVVGR